MLWNLALKQLSIAQGFISHCSPYNFMHASLVEGMTAVLSLKEAEMTTNLSSKSISKHRKNADHTKVDEKEKSANLLLNGSTKSYADLCCRKGMQAFGGDDVNREDSDQDDLVLQRRQKQQSRAEQREAARSRQEAFDWLQARPSWLPTEVDQWPLAP